MNNIIEKTNDLDEFVKKGYKIVYPMDKNTSIKTDVIIEVDTGLCVIKKSPLKKALYCNKLNLYQKFFSLRNNLFLEPSDFRPEQIERAILKFSNGKFSDEYNIKSISIYSRNKYSKINSFYEKINYILFNPNEKSVVFIVDNDFKTKDNKKLENKNKNYIEFKNQLKSILDE